MKTARHGRADCTVPLSVRPSVHLSLLCALAACGGYPSLPGEPGGDRGPAGDPLGPPAGGDGGRSDEPLPAPSWPPLQSGLEAVALEFGPDTAAAVYDLSNERYEPGRVRLGGDWYDVGLRLRGDGARFHPKLSWKTHHPGGVLVGGQRTRNFLAEYLDGGYLSDPFSYGLMLGAAVRSPRARFVTLDVNGEHQGVYVELQQVDKHFLRERGFHEESNVYRCGARDCELKVAPPRSYQHPWEKKTNEAEPWDDLWTFIRELARTPQHELAAWLEENLDLDGFVRFYAVSILISNSGIDDSGSYLVRDRATGKWTWVPWDLNNAALVFSRESKLSWGPELDYAIPTYTLYDPATLGVAAGKSRRLGVDAHPPFVVLFQRIWDLPELRNRILDEVEAMLDGVFSPEQALPRVDALHAIIRDALPRDPWVIQAQAAEAPEWLGRYVSGRAAFLRAEIPRERHRGEGGLVVNAVGPGFIELYNREDVARPLAGLDLTSDLRVRAQAPLLAEVTVAPHGKVTLPFTASAEGGEVGVFDAATSMPLDAVYYPPLGGRSYARQPDGAESWSWR